jgi:type II restriction/modification system DNA methylase subunit YeeA
MTPEQFVAKWKGSQLGERQASQEQFIDLCRLLDEKTPAEADATGESYCFERGAAKMEGGEGWADVWKRGHFAWEYKGKHKDLDAAYRQLQQYRDDLESPPLLVVSDMERFIVRTNWTNTVQRRHEFTLDDFLKPATRELFKRLFAEPEALKPGLTREALTADAAARFSELAERLHRRGHDPQAVAHFVNRLVFCMFAEDVDLLPNKMFARLIAHAREKPADFEPMARDLFGAMQTGRRVGFEKVEWFNGGLFDSDAAFPLEKADVDLLDRTAKLDWAEIDPSIFGTLFERGLDPDKRGQLGAHYTDAGKIMKIVEPVIVRALTAEWQAVKAEIADKLAKVAKVASAGAKTARRKEARKLHQEFLERLRNFRVLDPACGSGNFLYLALLALKDIEHRANLDVEAMGLERPFPGVGPQVVKGIELNVYAAELARVTVWIGEIQWMRRNGFKVAGEPVLKPLDTIECRDAVLNADGTEAVWAAADVIIGNPPFLGDKSMIGGLGEDYVKALRRAYAGRVPGGADFVCYWFEKARALIAAGQVRRAGLVATNSIRGGANRIVLDRIRDTGVIFDSWSDEPWILDGAAVRVSLVCFASKNAGNALPPVLNGQVVQDVYADLTAGGVDVTSAKRLAENSGTSFQGVTKSGPFDISGDIARSWLQLPVNPNGRGNSDVLRRIVSGGEIAKGPVDRWVVDFGTSRDEAAAALYEAPFEYAQSVVKPFRSKSRQRANREIWWQYERPRPEMWSRLAGKIRYLATPKVSKHRVFVWLPVTMVPDNLVIVIARDDDTTFGIVHSRFHEVWALRKGAYIGVGNDPTYTPTSTFETFPFPEGLTPNIPAADYATDPRAIRIAEAARRLNELRENWLNPPDLVRREPEVVPGFPDRILPVDEDAAAVLKRRTLTNLYNERPAWLDHAHRDLDAAVAAAYGWPTDISDDEALRRLFELNQNRAAG